MDKGVIPVRPAAPETPPFLRTGVLWRLVNYSNLQIAVVELTSLERVKIFSLIEHLLPLIQSLFKGSFCCCGCYVPGFRYRHVLAAPEMAQPFSPHPVKPGKRNVPLLPSWLFSLGMSLGWHRPRRDTVRASC